MQVDTGPRIHSIRLHISCRLYGVQSLSLGIPFRTMVKEKERKLMVQVVRCIERRHRALGVGVVDNPSKYCALPEGSYS